MNIKNFFKSEQGKRWIFPLVLFFITILLSAFRIHGSSIGIYHQVFNGKDSKDPNLIANQPQINRSDEWMVNTGYSLSQKLNDYKEINNLIGSGLNITLDTDAPFLSWFTIFKPQNLPFFILPVQFAFAVKWWLLGYSLVVACYFFILHFLPKKIMFAAFMSLTLFFSPFTQWWYQSITILPMTYSFLILLTLFKFIKTQSTKHLILLGLLLSYIFICFILILYPPFQIPCAIVAGGFFIGYLLQNRSTVIKGFWKKQTIVLVGSVVLAGAVVLLFVYTRSDAILALKHSVYPGSRITRGGGWKIRNLLDGLYNYYLQFDSNAASYYTNQSEASRHILVFPFLIIPMVYIVIKKFTGEKIVDFIQLSILTAAAILTARMIFPLPNSIARFLMLHHAQTGRLIIAFGLINIFAITAVVAYLQSKKNKLPKYIIIISAMVALFINYRIIRAVHFYYPDYLKPYWVGFLLVIALSAVVLFIMTKRPTTAALILLCLGILSTYKINPLYRGLGVTKNDQLNRVLSDVDPGKNSTWALANPRLLTNYLQMNGYHALSGVYLYPDLKTWEKYDVASDEKIIYNRFTHTVFMPTDEINGTTNFDQVSEDFFIARLNGCSDNARQAIDYILSNIKMTNMCMTKLKQINFEGLTLYVYKLNK